LLNSKFESVVSQILINAFPPGPDRGLVVTFAGLSGSGKTTLAFALKEALARYGRSEVTMLDGDILRRTFSDDLGYSRRDRRKQMERIALIASTVATHRGTAIISTMAPYKADRTKLRDRILEVAGNYVLIHVATSGEACVQRDTKGLYERAKRGYMKDLSGVHQTYQQIAKDEDHMQVRGENSSGSVRRTVHNIIEHLIMRGFLRNHHS